MTVTRKWEEFHPGSHVYFLWKVSWNVWTIDWLASISAASSVSQPNDMFSLCSPLIDFLLPPLPLLLLACLFRSASCWSSMVFHLQAVRVSSFYQSSLRFNFIAAKAKQDFLSKVVTSRWLGTMTIWFSDSSGQSAQLLLSVTSIVKEGAAHWGRSFWRSTGWGKKHSTKPVASRHLVSKSNVVSKKQFLWNEMNELLFPSFYECTSVDF